MILLFVCMDRVSSLVEKCQSDTEQRLKNPREQKQEQGNLRNAAGA
jgi:hypothetical protein